MNNKDQLLGGNFVEGLNNMYSHLGAQMFVPFYALSNFFLPAVDLQTSVGNVMNKESVSEYDHVMLNLESSNISPKVYSILEQKAKANELEDYISKLVEQDLDKLDKEEETITLLDTLRNEFLGKINILKQEFASRLVVDPDRRGAGQANELRDFVTKLGEQKLDKEEFRMLLNSLRSDLLDEISMLKNELASRPVLPANSIESKSAMEHVEEENDLKEGQLLESDQVTGTIKEVIDMDF